MVKGKAKPRKVRNKKYLRELKSIASDWGFSFSGINGKTHYTFTNGVNKIVVPSTPRVEGTSLAKFKKSCEDLS